MKVFIMWSGARSKILARELHQFLAAVVQRPQYFVSTEDIRTGTVWNNVIAGELETTHFGIACLCRDNLMSTWIHFEAGAISKASTEATVVPYLVGVDPSEVVGPLTKFQATVADRKGTLSLVHSINAAQPEVDRTSATALDTVFNALWGKLAKTIEDALSLPDDAIKAQPRSQDDILKEILNRLRDLERQTTRVWKIPAVEWSETGTEDSRFFHRKLSGKRILWVDDHPENNLSASRYLEERDCVVHKAISTEEALSMLSILKSDIDLVISDMGRGDDPHAGIKLLQAMQKTKYVVPCIIYSTSKEAKQKESDIARLGAIGPIIGPSNLIKHIVANMPLRD